MLRIPAPPPIRQQILAVNKFFFFFFFFPTLNLQKENDIYIFFLKKDGEYIYINFFWRGKNGETRHPKKTKKSF